MRLLARMILPCLFLAGCATEAAREAQTAGQELSAAQAELSACVERTFASPRYAGLVAHTPKDVRDATIANLSDETSLAPDDKGAFSDFYAELSQCKKGQEDHFSRAVPGAVQYLVEQKNALDDAAIALSEQKISWGAFNQRRKAAFAATQPKIAAAIQDLHAELLAEHQEEMARRQQAAQMFMQSAQNQQLINALTRPQLPQIISPSASFTNCNTYGSSTNCVTH